MSDKLFVWGLVEEVPEAPSNWSGAHSLLAAVWNSILSSTQKDLRVCGEALLVSSASPPREGEDPVFTKVKVRRHLRREIGQDGSPVIPWPFWRRPTTKDSRVPVALKPTPANLDHVQAVALELFRLGVDRMDEELDDAEVTAWMVALLRGERAPVLGIEVTPLDKEILEFTENLQRLGAQVQRALPSPAANKSFNRLAGAMKPLAKKLMAAPKSTEHEPLRELRTRLLTMGDRHDFFDLEPREYLVHVGWMGFVAGFIGRGGSPVASAAKRSVEQADLDMLETMEKHWGRKLAPRFEAQFAEDESRRLAAEREEFWDLERA